MRPTRVLSCLASLVLGGAIPAAAQTVSTEVCGINVNADCAVDAAGNLYVSNAANMIVKVTPSGDRSLLENVPCISCNGMAFNEAGETLYVANSFAGAGVIYEIAPDGTSSVYASGLSQPLSLAFGPDGFLYTTGAVNVYKIAPDGTNQIISSTGINRPHGLAVDSAGNVYVASAHDGNIYKLAPDGVGGYNRTLFAFVDGLIAPWACGYMTCVDDALFITNGDNIVHRISLADGTVTDYAGSGEAGWDDGPAASATFIAPNGICASPDGSRLYIAEYAEGRIRLIEGVTSSAPSPAPASDRIQPQLRVTPNPGNDQAVLRYELMKTGKVRLAIFDATGARVRTLVDDTRGRGVHVDVWDGRDQRGRLVSSGVYYSRLETFQGTLTETVTLIR